MKKLITFTLLAIVMLSVSCKERYYNRDVQVQTATVAPVAVNNAIIKEYDLGYNNKILVINIDDCEYLLYRGDSSSSGKGIVHKANCSNH